MKNSVKEQINLREAYIGALMNGEPSEYDLCDPDDIIRCIKDLYDMDVDKVDLDELENEIEFELLNKL